MVVTHGPRGHGSGRAKSAEAEAERRARIRAAVRARSKRDYVVVQAGYRKLGTSVDKNGHRRPDRSHINYETRTYRTYIPSGTGTNYKKLAEHLDRTYGQGRRAHFSARVVEYL